MSKWPLIETAPTDGTKVFLWRDGWPFAPVAQWGECDTDEGTFFGWRFEEDIYIPGACEEGFIGWEEDIAGGCMPTHWQPLPSPEQGE